MKKMLLTVAIAAFGMAAYADDVNTTVSTTADFTEEVYYKDPKGYSVETNLFWENWFISLGGGAQTFFADHNKQLLWKNRITPAIDFAIGKWFTPGIGVRGMYTGYSLKGATQNGSYTTGQDITEKPQWGYWLEYQEFNYMNLHLDVLFNMSNLLCGFKEKRIYNAIPYFGMGWVAVLEDASRLPVGAPAREVGANIGLMNQFRLNRHLDLNVDVRGSYIHESIDGETGGRYGEGILTATANLVWKIGGNTWDRSKTIIRYDNRTIRELREMMDKLSRDNEQLQKALEDCDKAAADTIVKKISIIAPNLVTFKINTSTLSKEARVNLGMLAEVIKQSDPNIVYTITGYADAATGNNKINDRLSKERAQVVYDCLTNEFGVNPKQLRMESKGGVENMFYDDPALSRAVITRGDLK